MVDRAGPGSLRARLEDAAARELAEQALRPKASQRDAVEATGLGWGLQRPMDAAGHAGGGPGWSASLIMRPSTGRTSVVLTSRLVPVVSVNARLIRSAA